VTRALSHAEAREELAAAALDALPGEERAAVLAHAADCAECRAELATYAEAATQLAGAVPVVPLEPSRSLTMRARLLERAATDAAARGGRHERDEPSAASAPHPAAASRREGEPIAKHSPSAADLRARRRWGMAGWLAAAASIAFLVAAAALSSVRRERDALRIALRASGARAAARAESLSVALADKTRMLDAITGPSVRVVELTGAGTREPIARMFWDRASNRWTMVAHNLPVPPAGRTYQVWLVTADAKISAGTFEPSPAGDVMMQAEYALAPEALQAVAVTEEPMGGMPQPTGRMVIVGTPPRVNR